MLAGPCSLHSIILMSVLLMSVLLVSVLLRSMPSSGFFNLFRLRAGLSLLMFLWFPQKLSLQLTVALFKGVI